MNESFWHVPDAAQRRATILWGTLLSAWFALIFGGAWYVTTLHAWRVPIHFEWELAIPLWPWMVVVYETMLVAFAIAPFVLRSPAEVRALVLALGGEMLIAGIVFVLVPAEAAYAPMPDDLGVWTWPLRIATTLNLGTGSNMAPSLHVALGLTCLWVFADRAGPTGKALLWLWAIAIAASTLLLHQHHFVDVLSGIALSCLGKCFVFDPLISRAPIHASAIV